MCCTIKSDDIQEFSAPLWPVECNEFFAASIDVQRTMGVTLVGAPHQMDESVLRDYLISYIRLLFGFDMQNLISSITKSTTSTIGIQWHIGCTSLLSKYVLLKIRVLPLSPLLYTAAPPLILMRPFKCNLHANKITSTKLETSDASGMETENQIIQNCLLTNALPLMAAIVLCEELRVRGCTSCRSVIDLYGKWDALIQKMVHQRVENSAHQLSQRNASTSNEEYTSNRRHSLKRVKELKLSPINFIHMKRCHLYAEIEENCFHQIIDTLQEFQSTSYSKSI